MATTLLDASAKLYRSAVRIVSLEEEEKLSDSSVHSDTAGFHRTIASVAAVVLLLLLLLKMTRGNDREVAAESRHYCAKKKRDGMPMPATGCDSPPT